MSDRDDKAEKETDRMIEYVCENFGGIENVEIEQGNILAVETKSGIRITMQTIKDYKGVSES